MCLHKVLAESGGWWWVVRWGVAEAAVGGCANTGPGPLSCRAPCPAPTCRQVVVGDVLAAPRITDDGGASIRVQLG